MKTWEIEWIVKFLHRYADNLGDRGCNDFDMEAMIPDVKERRLFIKDYHDWNGDPEEFDPEYLELPDFAVVGFLAHRLETFDKEMKSE